jgi:hypothetical protein
MTSKRPSLSVARYSRHSHNRWHSSNKVLKAALWMIWLPIAAVLWVMLDTSYDWISSPSNIKVIYGFLILILMALVVIALLVKGARKLWTR